jgi:hypothetical protein
MLPAVDTDMRSIAASELSHVVGGTVGGTDDHGDPCARFDVEGHDTAARGGLGNYLTGGGFHAAAARCRAARADRAVLRRLFGG